MIRMSANPEEIRDKLVELGIRGLLIITRNGLPILVRPYVKSGQIFGKDPALFSGFLAGLGKFADDQTAGLLSDIGLHTVRLFFDYTEDMIFLLAFDEIKLEHLSGMEVRTLVKGTMAEIKSSIQAYFSDAGITIDKIVDNPKLFEHHRNNLTTIALVLDRIVYKSHVQLLEVMNDNRDADDEF